jgi:hypothetical protein
MFTSLSIPAGIDMAKSGLLPAFSTQIASPHREAGYVQGRRKYQ